MKFIKRIFFVVIFLVLISLVAAIAIPYLYQDKITDFIKQKANEEIEADLDFSAVKLSIIRSFPQLSFGLEDFSLLSRDSLAQFDTIAYVGNFYLDFDFMEIFKDPKNIEINSFLVENSTINLYTDLEGNANYDIYNDPSAATNDKNEEGSSEIFKNISLEDYQVINCNLNYIDKPSGINMAIKSLDHKGKGNFDLEVFDFETNTQIDKLSMNFGGVQYLNKVQLQSQLNVLADLGNSNFVLKENNIRLNALEMEAEGEINLKEDNPILDLSIKSTKTDFKQFLSLIPAIYAKDFANITANGSFDLNGAIKGQLGPGDNIPAFNFDINIADGFFKYPSISQTVSDVSSNIKIRQASNNLDAMTVEINPFELTIAGEKNIGNLSVSNVISNPKFNGFIDGAVVIDKVKDLVEVEALQMSGDRVSYDVKFAGDYNSIISENYEDIALEGTSNISRLDVSYDTNPRVQIQSTDIAFSPQAVSISPFNMKAGKSDFAGQVELMHPLLILTEIGKPRLVGNITSQILDGDEWMGSETNSDAAANSSPSVSEDFEIPVDLDLKYSAGKMSAMDQVLTNVESDISLANDQFSINSFKGNYESTPFYVNGKLSNLTEYLNSKGAVFGNISGDLGRINLNKFLEETEEVAIETTGSGDVASSALSIPSDMNLALDFKAKEMLFQDYSLKEAVFQGKLGDGKLLISNASGKTFGGEIGMKGIIETPLNEKPKVDFAYSMKSIDFVQIFNKVVTFQKLAPFAKYIEGNFNLDLDFSGLLNNDMSFDMNSINADGFLQTLKTVVQGYTPLNGLAEKYSISQLKGFDLTGTKNWISISDGKVFIKEFTKDVGGNKFTIEGNHGIDQIIDYQIKTKIPRAKLNGTGINKGLDLILGEANKLGLNIDAGEFIDVQFNLKGAFEKPDVKFKVLGVSSGDGSTTSVKDAVTGQVKDKLEEEKKKLQDKLEAEKKKKEDELRNKLDQEKKKLEDAKNKKEAELRKKIEEEKRKKEAAIKKKIEEEKKKAEDEIKKKLEEEKKKLKDKLGKFNPF